MQHSSAIPASLRPENGIFPWRGAESLARAASVFDHLGYVCLVANRQASDVPPPTAEEQQAARGTRDPTGFLIRRGIARALAAALLNRPAAQLVIRPNAHGAPQIEDTPLYLSFSARDALGLIGIGRMPLGVDYEPALPAAGIPWNLLRADERAVLEGLLLEARDSAFLRLWRSKEAALKALGLGFVLPPEAVTVLDQEALIAGQEARIRLVDVPDAGITLGLHTP